MAPKALVADRDKAEEAAVENFLREAGLGGYADKLIEAGIDTMPELVRLSKQDCEGFGIGPAKFNRFQNALSKYNGSGGAASPSKPATVATPQSNGTATVATPQSNGTAALTFNKASFVVDHPETDNIRRFFDIQKKLGEGSIGAVYKAQSNGTGARRAIKGVRVCDMTKEEAQIFTTEVSLLREADHPNVVKLYEIFKDRRMTYLVMELCEGGELFDMLLQHYPEGYPEKTSAKMMQHILRGVQYLHGAGIVHRDLKAENFLLKYTKPDSEIKLIDFGAACRWKPGQILKESIGTPQYVAPEVLKYSYDNKCDIWSCGVLLYILLCGFQPFYGEDDTQVLDMVEAARYEFPAPEWNNVSSMAKNLVNELLRKSPKSRVDAGQALGNTWFQNAPDVDQMEAGEASSVMSKLKGFQKDKQLKKLALTMVATQLSDKDVEKLKEQFTALDKNGDGTLTSEELQEGLKGGLSGGLSPEDLKAFQELDTNGTGTIEYTEFISACVDRSSAAKKDVAWNAFCSFDVNGDGKISQEELSKVLRMGGDTKKVIDRDKVQSLISEADINGDGFVDFDEFLTMLKS